MNYQKPIARWYERYSYSNIQHVYSPNSVVNAMLDGEFGSFWVGTAAYESLKNYISMNFDGLKDTIIQLLAGSRCRVDIDTFENDMTSFRRKDDVLTILIHLGYLAYDHHARDVYIPNEEVRGTFQKAVLGTAKLTPFRSENPA